MQITLNTSPFVVDRFVSTDKSGQKHLVVVVKATYEADAKGRCTSVAEPEPLVYTDAHYGDPGTSAVEYESDFAPVKPRVDVLVHGSAMARAGQVVESLRVGLFGPGIEKYAQVTGDRCWVRGLTGLEASNPQPFETMPLSWDRAFGGTDQSHTDARKNGSEVRNLVGVGFHLNSRSETILGQALPNVERIGASMSAWSDKPEPVGFGVVSRGCQPRIRFAGTYDKAWREGRSPFLPEDFDNRYFQAAPLDQQLSGLHAGERFACVNMSRNGTFVAEVPRFEVPVSFFFDDRTGHATITADTVILEPDQARLVLVGRASVVLPRKLARLHEIHVGTRKSACLGDKTHFCSLSAVAAASRLSSSATR